MMSEQQLCAEREQRRLAALACAHLDDLRQAFRTLTYLMLDLALLVRED